MRSTGPCQGRGTGEALTGIAGSPAGVEAAATTVQRAGGRFTDAADAIASHGRTVTADWTGSASDAAGAAIAALATRTRVGAQVSGPVGPVLTTCAAELRAAQAQYDHAAATAADGAVAQRAAGLQQSAADASGAADPARGAAQDAAGRAVARAAAQVSAAHTDMADAVVRAERDNQVAADAVDAHTDQLAAMDGTTSNQAMCTVPAGYSPRSERPSSHDGTWWHDVTSWAVEHAGDISAAAGTAAFVTAFIPGVDVIATPLLAAVSVAAGAVATGDDIVDGDSGAAVVDGVFTVLGAVPGVGALRVLGKVDDAAGLLRDARGLPGVSESSLPGGGALRAADRVEAVTRAAGVAGEAVDARRITIPEGEFGYLLENPSRSGVFTGSVGFEGDELDVALHDRLVNNMARASHPEPMTGGGYKFTVGGPMTGPTGMTWDIRSAWSVETDGTVRLITATP